MTCQEVMELMQRELDRDLDESERAFLSDHLEQCPECAEMFEKLKKLSVELERLPKVAPPSNLVDAILPQLAEIDRMRLEEQEGHAASKDNTDGNTIGDSSSAISLKERQTARPNGRKRFFERGSFAVVGGVVAAGIVLGLFVMQSDLGQFQVADDSKLMNESAAKKQNESDAASQMAETKGAVGSKPSDNRSGQAAGSARELTAKNKAEDLRQPSNKAGAGANSTEGTAASPVLTDSGAQSPVRSGASDKNISPSDGTAPPSSEQAVQPFAQKSAQPPSGDEQQKTVQPPSQEPEQVPANKSAADPAPSADAPQFGISSMGSAEAPKQPADANAKMQQPLGFAAPVQAVRELVSPNGNYRAVIEQQTVLVRQNGKTVFTSRTQWAVSVNLRLLRWENESKLYYDAVLSPEKVKHMMIDLQTNTEAEIQN